MSKISTASLTGSKASAEPPAQYRHAKQELSAWLRAEAGAFRGGIVALLGLSLLAFAAQVAALSGLSHLAHGWVIESRPAPASLPGVIVLALLLQWLLLSWREKLRLTLGRRVKEYYHTRLRRQIEKRSLALIREYSTASWQSFLTRRVSALQRYFCDYLPQTFLAVLIPLLVLIVVLPFSWLVALTLLLSAPLIPLFMYLVGMGAAAAHRRHFLAIERLGAIFLDRLKARQLLQIFARVPAERVFFAQASEELKRRTLKVVSLAFVSSSVLDFFATLSIALVAVFVGFALLGELSFGFWSAQPRFQEGLFVLLMAPLFFAELRTLGRDYHSKAEALGAADELFAVLELPELALTLKPLPLSLPAFRVLSSDGAVALLQLPGLDLRKGEHVLLSGPSGCGKSSLLEALLGMRPMERLQSQEPVACLDRRRVAWLDQSPPILPGSVRENLAPVHSPGDERLYSVLEAVGLAGWLAGQPEGLETRMGDYPPLSGGQRQRLAIARLLLQEPELAFLDEPLAHLAPAQRESIGALLERALAETTVVWVAHDLSPGDFFSTHWQLDEAGGFSSVPRGILRDD